ncbi:MAG: hypothetical protein CXR31_08630 [Geobacter sp.]|nr:MAG: hypothetical protein CXR31_08630 [Geobacter sp.]
MHPVRTGVAAVVTFPVDGRFMQKPPYNNLSWKIFFLIGCVLLVAFWFLDEMLDALLLKEGGFASVVIAHEVFMRLMLSALLLVVVWFVWRVARLQTRLKNALNEAQDRYNAEKVRSEAILSAMSDAISVQDLNFKILYQNQAHKEMMGEHESEYCYAAYQQKDSMCEGCHLARSFRDGFRHRREVSTVTERGTRYVEIISSPLRDAGGTIIAGIESIRDITERREAEEKLRQQQIAMEASMDGIAIYHDRRGFVYLNEAFVGLYGYDSASEILEASWRILLPPEELARYEREDRPILLREGRWRGELIGKRKNAVTFPMEISLTASEGGNTVVVVRDITDRKRIDQEIQTLSHDLADRAAALLVANTDLLAAKNRAEEEKNKSEAIIAAMGDGVSIQGLDFKVMYQNKVHQDIVGGSFVGSYCYQAYSCRDKLCEGCPIVRCYKDGLIHKLLKILPSGIPIGVTASPLRDAEGNIIAGIEVVRDMTQQVKSEQALKEQTALLQQQTLELISSNKELESFSYTLSHDLRSPLTRIYAAGQALLEMYGETLDENGRTFLHAICEGSEHMEELIEAILALSGVTRSEMHTEDVDLSGLAKTIASKLQITAPGRRVDFVIATGVTSFCDPQLMKIALENLLGNAWKYSRKTPFARIEFGVTERDGETVYFVRDNGAGFDMKNAAELFAPFKRLHATSDFPGTGIGLATVQRVIERHGGTVWAEAEVGKGAIFYFTLKQMSSAPSP